ncbi:hypothetical protein [Methylobacterium sp. NEAU K]|nr:hypothetical protein [Methylobacterium sp. NEAU K]MDP4003444.1 hypothetical protein [Methylobacterium sp. NEAU K]
MAGVFARWDARIGSRVRALASRLSAGPTLIAFVDPSPHGRAA